MKPVIACLLLILSLLSGGGALAGEIGGTASVIDGDTLEIHDQRIRMNGIDAPESSQTCTRDGVSIRCGRDAAFYLSNLIGREPIYCTIHSVDRYDRLIASCFLISNGLDLGSAMVAAGQAVAYRRYSMDYVPEEEAAKAGGVGIWSTEFQMPWDWRQANR